MMAQKSKDFNNYWLQPFDSLTAPLHWSIKIPPFKRKKEFSERVEQNQPLGQKIHPW